MSEKLFFNGDILTMEEELYVEAVLVKDNKIYKTGKKDELIKLANSNVELIDLDGKVLMPAFIDSHSHFSACANSFLQVSLEEAKSFNDIVDIIKRFIKENNIKPRTWINAYGYDHNSLNEGKHPSKEVLDEISLENPIIIQHKSGHMGVVNSIALNELEITYDTESPEGGMIEKNGYDLTGYLEENAFIYYLKKVPMCSIDDYAKAMINAQEKYASNGITTIQEGLIAKELAPILDYVRKANLLKLDLIGYIDINFVEELTEQFKYVLKNYNNHFKIGGYKIFLDGSPQGRTAWMLEPYKDAKDGYRGYSIYKNEVLEKNIKRAIDDNVQLLAHCNGDAAVDQYISQYKNVKERLIDNSDIRPVIVHAQFLKKEQLDEVKYLKMIPSFFIAHVYYWGDIHIKNFGKERADRISIAKSALNKGIKFTFHQDAPVIEPNMLETIWCAVNRITKKGIILGEEERISPLEALKAITINAAYQYFEEDIKGSIKANKLADLVILDLNPLKVNTNDIKNIKVLKTIKEGEIIFDNNIKISSFFLGD